MDGLVLLSRALGYRIKKLRPRIQDQMVLDGLVNLRATLRLLARAMPQVFYCVVPLET